MVTIHDGLERLKKQLEGVQEIKEKIEIYAKRKKLWEKIKETWGEETDEDIENFIVEEENIPWLLPEAEAGKSTGRLLLSLHKRLEKGGRLRKRLGKGWEKVLKKAFIKFAGKGVGKYLEENMPIEQEGTWREEYVPLGDKLVEYLKLSLGEKNFKNSLSDKWGFIWLFEGGRERRNPQRKYRDKGMITGSFIDHRANYQEYLKGEIYEELEDPLSFGRDDMTRFEEWLRKFYYYLIKNRGYMFLKKVLSESIKERKDDLKEMILEVRFFDEPILREKSRKKAIREALLDTSLLGGKSFLDQLLGNFVNEILPSNIRSLKELRVNIKKLENMLGRGEFKDVINRKLGPQIYDQIMSSPHKRSEKYLNTLGDNRGEKQKSINRLVRRKVKDKIKKGMKKIWKEEVKKAFKMRNELLHRGIKILGEIALLITMLVKAWSIENNEDLSDYGIYAPGEPKGSIK